jgi:hypothetical protein
MAGWENPELSWGFVRWENHRTMCGGFQASHIWLPEGNWSNYDYFIIYQPNRVSSTIFAKYGLWLSQPPEKWMFIKGGHHPVSMIENKCFNVFPTIKQNMCLERLKRWKKDAFLFSNTKPKIRNCNGEMWTDTAQPKTKIFVCPHEMMTTKKHVDTPVPQLCYMPFYDGWQKAFVEPVQPLHQSHQFR